MTDRRAVWFVIHRDQRKGAYPVHRKGWLLVCGYFASFLVAGTLLFFLPTIAGILLFAAVVTMSSILYFWLRRRHTDYSLPQSSYKGARKHARN